jgi:tripartite-type tricarboxylate transporter receptor subunit TctC
MGGQIDAAIAAFIPSAVNMKVVGVTWSERIAVLPEVPTFRESGLDIVSGLSLSLAVPVGTPQDVVGKLNAATNDFLKSERGKTFETRYALQIAGGTPEEARDFLAGEAKRLIPVIRAANISVE